MGMYPTCTHEEVVAGLIQLRLCIVDGARFAVTDEPPLGTSCFVELHEVIP